MHAKSACQDWTRLVSELLNDIAEWSRAQQWLVEWKDAERHEPEFGTYATKQLVIQGPQGRLVVDPVAKSVVDAEGRVDLYAWPSMNRVLILRTGGQWRLRTASGVDWPKTWGRDTFQDLASQLMAS